MKEEREKNNVADVQPVYEAPHVEVIEVEVEKGFSVSGNADLSDYGYGGRL